MRDNYEPIPFYGTEKCKSCLHFHKCLECKNYEYNQCGTETTTSRADYYYDDPRYTKTGGTTTC